MRSALDLFTSPARCAPRYSLPMKVHVKNPKCWARKLDDCSDKITRERRISVAAWPSTFGATRDEKERHKIVFQRGNVGLNGTRQIDVPGGFDRRLTLRNFTIKALCDVHNPELTNVDQESGRLTAAIHDFHTTWRQNRSIPGLPCARKAFAIDGFLLERWFLKTAITNTL